MFLKNTSGQKFILYAYTPADGLPATGAAAGITPYVAKDWGAATALGTATATEIDATNAPGYYTVAPTQGETNADALHVTAKHSTSTIKVLGAPAVIFPLPATGVLSPATLGRTLVVDAAGLADANVVKAGPTGSGVAVSAWSATRGLAGTALPNAAAAAAGGLPVSAAGGLDLDAMNAAAVRLTAARAQVLDDWINGGRLDALIDAIKVVTDAIPNAGSMSSIATAAALSAAQSDLTTLVGRLTALRAGYLDNLSGGAVALASTLATVAGYIDTEVAAIFAAVDTEIAAIKAVTDLLPNGGALSDLGTIAGRLTALRAGYLDNLSGGAVALASVLATVPADVWVHASRTLTSGAAPSAADVADAVWDEAMAGHVAAGSAGQALGAAGSAADPLLNAVPGSYVSGSAGYALGRIGTSPVTITSPVNINGTLELLSGDSYANADGRAIVWSAPASAWPDLTAKTVVFRRGAFMKAMTVVTSGVGSQSVRLELTSDDTRGMASGPGNASIEVAISSTSRATLLRLDVRVQNT